ncbi:MAG: hypothetical protein C4521_02870 [Actinobacteria bacterium]|nr:MAG: hypothetical protein C4521_02870 [Actinomycetota bacterium]
MYIYGKAGLLRSAAITILVTVLVAAPVIGVQAEPSVDTKREQAKQIQSQVSALDEKLEIAVEEYNKASDELAMTQEQLEVTREKLGKARKRLATRQFLLNRRAKSIYLHGKINFLEVVLATQSFDDFLTRLDLVKRIGESDARIVGSVKAAKRVLDTRKRLLAAQQAKQRRITAEREKKKSSIEGTLAKRKQMLSGIKDEIAAYERQERERARRQRARYLALQRQRESSSGGGGGDSTDDGGSGAGVPAHGNVVSYAYSRLGCPYVWGASGPNSFDCSGLTMWCYSQVGISLPHSSAAQYGCGTHISRDNLQPGDLVFFGNPIHHVGIYVGGGNMIHAPRTGDVVKVSSVDGHGNYAGATRP